MDLQEIMDAMGAKKRQEALEHSPQLTLGELIILLDNVEEPENPLVFDDGDYCPTGVGSWRGSYKEFALRYDSTDDTAPMSVNNFLPVLESAEGGEFRGYKGGDFLMTNTTPVWVANRGDSSGFANYGEFIDRQGVVGVSQDSSVVVIETDEVPHYA